MATIAAVLSRAPFSECTPSVRVQERRSSVCTFAGGKKNPEHKRRHNYKRRGAPQKEADASTNGAAPVRPNKLSLVTGPPVIETERVLQAAAPALDPWWSTFIGHMEGVWAGKCAAFNMADGKMEPMTIEGDNIKIKELHTRVIEAGGEIDENPALLRKTLKQIKLCQMEEFAEHAEKSCLMADAAGLLHFDGGSYSSSLSDLATNCLGDEEVLPDDQLFGAEPTTGGWGEAAEDSGADADTESDSEGDQKGVAEGSELDVWETALEQIVSDSTVMDGSDEMDEDAEWRQVARAEMLEEHYRGAAKVATLEHCLAVGGKERVRLQLLLETRGGRREELDVQVLRMVLFKELWMGDVDHSASPPLHKVNIAESRRAAAAEHVGNFQCLTLTSVVVPPDPTEGSLSQSDDPSLLTDESGDELELEGEPTVSGKENTADNTESTAEIEGKGEPNGQVGGQDKSGVGSGVGAVAGSAGNSDSGAGMHGEGVVKAHFSTEVQQHWEAPVKGYGDDGVTWWLPHDVTCTIMMAPTLNAAKGGQGGAGLMVRTTWKRDSFLSVIETQFSPSGKLEESRFSSLVPEKNNIPSMNVPVKM